MIESPLWIYNKCPYCEKDNKFCTEGLKWGMNVVMCPVEEGGCNKHYAIYTTARIETKVYTISDLPVK